MRKLSPFSHTKLAYLTSEACDTRQGARHGCPNSGYAYVWDTLGLRLGQNKISHCKALVVTDILKSSQSRIADAQRECLALTTLWTTNTEGKLKHIHTHTCMCRTAMAWGSASAHNLAAYSQSELGFATHFNMYPEVQLLSPNGSLGHTRGQVNCAMARSKALINAGMPVYFVRNRKAHISNGTAKSVGIHSVSNSESGGVSVDDCATVPGPETASNCQTSSISVMTTEPIKIPLDVAFSAQRIMFS
jgi:hypothetical protein